MNPNEKTKKPLTVRIYTRDVYFYQLSVRMLFYWQGDVYAKLEGGLGQRRTNQAGEQVNKDFMTLAFAEDTIVTISNQDVNDLRFKS